jgi:hypothetical protein
MAASRGAGVEVLDLRKRDRNLFTGVSEKMVLEERNSRYKKENLDKS